MSQRLVIACLTAFGFAAGFGARMITESGPSVPPPPTPGTEFVRSSTAAPGGDKQRSPRTYSAKDRAKLVAEIEAIRPKIDQYRQRIEEIASEFDRDLVPILTPDQRDKFAIRLKKDADHRARGERQLAGSSTLSDEQIYELQQRPLWYAVSNISVNWRLERLNRDLKLDETQQAKARELLFARRDKFLALVDSIPPPTLGLSQLAPQVSKLNSSGTGN